MIDYVFRYDPQAPSKPNPRDAEEARKALEDGNRVFSRWMEDCRTGVTLGENPQYLVPCTGQEMGIVRHQDEMPKQKPFAVVVGCSDARVPTEMLFGQGFNNLFVTRVAGNVLGDVCLGSIDFALEALSESVRVVVVLGHSGCGAVKGAVDCYLEPQRFWARSNTPMLRLILQKIFVAVRESANALEGIWGAGASRHPAYREALTEAAVCLNAAHAAFALRTEIERTARWEVEVLYGVYNIRTHQVSMPVDPKAPASDTNVNLALAPTHPKELRGLALKMAAILRPTDLPPRRPAEADDDEAAEAGAGAAMA
jgi:carbonic anhydrase